MIATRRFCFGAISPSFQRSCTTASDSAQIDHDGPVLAFGLDDTVEDIPLKRAFGAFIDFVIARWVQFPYLHIYHSATYEAAALSAVVTKSHVYTTASIRAGTQASVVV
jgi:hypothetical protein